MSLRSYTDARSDTAVLDDVGVTACPVVGWSIGVNTQFELATSAPERVTGLFSVAGTLKALDYGLGPIAATALGVTTAVGGGVLRDVIARETPTLIRSGSELYAVPAAAGAAIVAVAWELGVYGPVLGAASAVAVFAVRGLALRRSWHAQHPVS